MPSITTADGTALYCKDWGNGQPIVLSHPRSTQTSSGNGMDSCAADLLAFIRK